MCKFSSKSGGVPFQILFFLGDLTRNDPLLIFKKSIISDMHHRAMYMYINFQQNQASRSVKTVHTNLFANNHKLH